MEFSLGNRHHHLTTHDLALHMGIGIVFVAVMTVLTHRFVRSQALQPLFIVVVQARFVIVDEDRGSDVHGVAQQ